MNIKSLQKEIKEFYTDYNLETAGVIEGKETSFAHLVEEVGELARQYVNKEQRPGKYDESEVKDALADILINVFWLGSLFEVDMEKEIQAVLDKDKRDLESKRKQ